MMFGMAANQEETDKVTVVLKEDESRGVMQDPLEKAETEIGNIAQ